MLGNTKTTDIKDDKTTNENTLSSNLSFYGKLTLSLIAGAAAIYYGGPVAAISARALFDKLYTLRFGEIPSMLSTDYWKVYMPMREHFGAQAYTYGPHMFGVISSFATYKTSQAASWLTSKVTGKKEITVAPKQPLTPAIVSTDEKVTPFITNPEEKVIPAGPSEPSTASHDKPVPTQEVDKMDTVIAKTGNKEPDDLDTQIEEIIKQLMAIDISDNADKPKKEKASDSYTVSDKEIDQLIEQFTGITLSYESLPTTSPEVKPQALALETNNSKQLSAA
ncbi:MAG: hypothetical protein AB7V32_11130 [Candidatus Berkiella sp.]